MFHLSGTCIGLVANYARQCLVEGAVTAAFGGRRTALKDPTDNMLLHFMERDQHPCFAGEVSAPLKVSMAIMIRT